MDAKPNQAAPLPDVTPKAVAPLPPLDPPTVAKPDEKANEITVGQAFKNVTDLVSTRKLSWGLWGCLGTIFALALSTIGFFVGIYSLWHRVEDVATKIVTEKTSATLEEMQIMRDAMECEHAMHDAICAGNFDAAIDTYQHFIQTYHQTALSEKTWA
jgi:hypothetical protein